MATRPETMKQEARLKAFQPSCRPQQPRAVSRLPCLPGLVSALGLTFCLPHAALAAAPIAPSAVIAPGPVTGGERLTDWMLKQRFTDDAYPQGLSWMAPSEEVAQSAMKSALRAHLMGSEWTFKASPEARKRMSDWINTLPVTGRVPVSVPDVRWLEAKPAENPLLAADHSVSVPRRPTTVTVITTDGKLCTVPHAGGFTARDYVNACRTAATAKARVDRVWIAQPDGQVQDFGIAGWNAETQGEPAPGAWIWAPVANSGWTDEFSGSLIRFLATQGPAPDQNAARPDARLAAAPVAIDKSLTAQIASSFGNSPPLRDRAITGNDWGGVGLIQTPTARMAPAGDFSLSFSRSYPFSNLNISLQPLDWLEVSYRYTSVSEQKFGPVIAGDQSYKDKSIDVKARLLKETALLPEVAVGARDALGTGLFSGEYFVANKRTGNFDWSLGLGWGQLGSASDFSNPLGFISPRFDTRPGTQGAGNVNLSFFRGPMAVFGGVQAQTPWDSIVAKLEYEGNDYRNPVPFDPISKRPVSRFNAGLVYRYSPTVDLTFSVQRGNVASFSLAIHNSLSDLSTPKLGDPALPRFTPQRPAPVSLANGGVAPVTDWLPTSEDILAQTTWRVSEISKRGEVLFVELTNADAVYWRDMVSRASAILHRDAPADVQEFRFQFKGRGTVLADIAVDRNEWVKSQNQPLLPTEKLEQRPPNFVAPAPAVPRLTQYKPQPDAFSYETGFRIKPNFGGPDGFILYAFSVETNAEWRLTDNTWASGSVDLRLLDNYNKFDYTAPSNLPRVRTFLREFNTTSRVTLPTLQLTHVGQLNTNQYYSVYGGYLESMYAGVGGEWMYRPFRSPLAVGVDMNAVRQRDFDQKLSLRDYKVATGHLTAYWDTGWKGVHATASVGQYLAGDKGATLGLAKRFDNGVIFGAYATKTNVSAEQFGEGSFDKGIYFTIPLSAMLTRSTPIRGTFAYNPLVRDGGAKLNRSYPLYEVTRVRDNAALTTVTPNNDARR